jgi:hypothetical protein
VRTRLTKRLRRSTAAFLLALPGVAPAAANDGALLEVTVDEARVVQLSGAAETIVLGNPAIADVNAQPANLLIVTGKSNGETNLIALAADGREILNTRISVHGARDNAVSVFLGSKQQTLHCAPLCDKAGARSDEAPAAPAGATKKSDAGKQ